MRLVDFPGGACDIELSSPNKKCKKRKFDPWVGKIPWRRAQQPTPVFPLPATASPGKSPVPP